MPTYEGQNVPYLLENFDVSSAVNSTCGRHFDEGFQSFDPKLFEDRIDGLVEDIFLHLQVGLEPLTILKVGLYLLFSLIRALVLV